MDLGVAPPERTGATTLADGRALAWSEWGHPTADPVLFVSGSAMGSSLGFGGDALAAMGARLIAVDRPGLGRSDHDPARSFASWVGDVRALIADRRLADVRIVSFSQGAPFGLALATAGIGVGHAVVSGQDELSHPSMASLVDGSIRPIVAAASTDPDELEAEFERRATASMMLQLIIDTSSPTDREVYESPVFEPAYRRCLEEGFSSGAAGYARDLRLAMGRWPFDVSSIATPVHLWYGGRDASTVHSPDRGATLAGRIPTARRHLVRHAGGSLLWTSSLEILTALFTA